MVVCRPLLCQGSAEDDVAFSNRLTVEAGVTVLPVWLALPIAAPITPVLQDNLHFVSQLVSYTPEPDPDGKAYSEMPSIYVIVVCCCIWLAC